MDTYIPSAWNVWLTSFQKADVVKLHSKLVSCGLTGRKLALQSSDSDRKSLVQQLLTECQVPEEWFYVKVINIWIDQAISMEPLAKRLMYTSSSSKMLDDAAHAPARIVFLKDVVRQSDITAFTVPARGMTFSLSKTFRHIHDSQDDTERDIAEKQALKEWTQELLIIFQQLDAPVLYELNDCMDVPRALEGIAGRARLNTLRNYIKVWQRFHRWLKFAKQKDVIDGPSDIVDFLFAREAEPCGPSVPLSTMIAIRWILKQAGMETNWAVSRSVINTVDFIREKLSGAAKLVRRAPRFFTAMLESMELYVLDSHKPKYLRIVCWVRLLKVWGALRYDCHTHIKPHELILSQSGLSTVLRRTKTTGGPRRVSELPICIGSHSYIANSKWLSEGFKLMRSVADFERDYLLPCGSRDCGSVVKKMARYEDASGAGVAVLRDLRYPNSDHKLLESETVEFWTEHSERNLLPSILVFLKADRAHCNMVGRWRPEGSELYMRTYNTVVAQLQKQCALAMKQPDRYESFGEEDILQELGDWLRKRKGLPSDKVDHIMDVTRQRMNRLPFSVASSPVSSVQPTIPVDVHCDVSSDSDSEGLAVTSKPGFLIIFDGSKGRLHKSSGCWHARYRKANKSTWHDVMPDSHEYHSICKLCWPPVSQDELGSDTDTQSSGGSIVQDVAQAIDDE
jgi:hypothetical protein